MKKLTPDDITIRQEILCCALISVFKDVRKSLNISQRILAEKGYASKGLICKLESLNKKLTLKNLVSMCFSLGISLKIEIRFKHKIYIINMADETVQDESELEKYATPEVFEIE